jgi:hypothetical protein
MRHVRPGSDCDWVLRLCLSCTKPVLLFESLSLLPDGFHAGSGICFDVWIFGIDADAGGEVVWLDLGELGRDGAALGNRELAAGVKMTAARRVDRRRDITL